MVDKGTYKGQPSLSKQLVSIVGVHGQVTTHPLAVAKLILSNGPAVHLTLLLGPHDRCLLGMIYWRVSCGWICGENSKQGQSPPLPHSLPHIDAPLLACYKQMLP